MKISLSKFCLLFAGLFLLPFLLYAQSWQWGTLSGSDGGAKVKDLNSDVHGNTYLLAEIGAATNIYANNIPLPDLKSRATSLLLVSTNGDGKHRWSKRFGGDYTGGSYLHNGTCLRVSNQGNVYVLATISSTSTYPGVFDTDTTLAPTKANQHITLICYDTSGKFKWLVRPDTNTGNPLTDPAHRAFSMDIDEDGNIYCLLSLPPGHPLLGTALSIPATAPFMGNACYVLKYNPNGVLLNVTMLQDFCFSNAAVGYLSHLSYNKLNKGYYIYTATHGDSIYLKNTPYLNQLFFGAYREDGSLKWHISDTAISNRGRQLTPSPIQADPMGNIYISGEMIQNNQINGYTLKGGACTYDNLPFIIKMDSTGKLLWGTHGESKTCASAYGFASSDFAIPASGKGVGTISGFGRGIGLFGQTKKDTVVMNGGLAFEFDAWYANIDPLTGKTVKLSTILSDKSSFYRTKVHYSKDQLYIAGSSDARLLMFDSSLLLPSKRTTAGEEVFLAKFGLPMGCTKAPVVSFTYKSPNFTFTGTSPADSVTWDFGDGNIGKGFAYTHKYLVKGIYKVCATLWTSDCGKLTKCQTVDVPLGIEQNHLDYPGLFIYPNPANEFIKIENLEEGSSINIFNVLGQKSYTGIVNNKKETIDISGWQTGHYLLLVINKNGRKQSVVVSKK